MSSTSVSSKEGPAVATKSIAKNSKAIDKDGKKLYAGTVSKLIQQQVVLRQKHFEVAKKFIQKYIKTKKPGNSMIVYRLKNIQERVDLWNKVLPRVNIFYATKCLQDGEVLKACLKAGTGFDVASTKEMNDCIELGAKPENMIFANPIKTKDQLQFAKKCNVKKMTFDCVEELQKIKKWFPEAECVIRILTASTDAKWNLNEKFGIHSENAHLLLKKAQSLKLRVKGVSFHVGTGGVSFSAYADSIRNARKIFDQAKNLGMQKMDFLDLGGGWSQLHENPENIFTNVGEKVAKLLDEVFPEKIQIIAEPGTYMVQSSCYMVSQIIGQKELNKNRHYYVNNGIYQGYMCRMFGEDMFVEPIEDLSSRKIASTTFWGQTCDSCDFICKDQPFPKMKTLEWVITQNHGAYQKDLSCTFNGFELPINIYVHDW